MLAFPATQLARKEYSIITETVPGDRSQESGVRGQKSGVRNQESGVRDQESGVRSQESGVRGQRSGVRGPNTQRPSSHLSQIFLFFLGNAEPQLGVCTEERGAFI